MKKLYRLFLLLFCAAVLCQPLSALAEDYTYTIRVYAGRQGEFTVGDDPKIYTVSGLHYGEIFRFDYENLVEVPEGSKYQVRGIRESGRDNSTVGASSFYVTKDADYVVAYRIPGELVAYTISYLEYGTNKELLPPATFYGNVGEEVVIAFPYIEGYTPVGLNGRWTLRSDQSNDRIFWYVSNELLMEDETTPTPTPAPVRTPAPAGTSAPEETASPSSGEPSGSGEASGSEGAAEADDTDTQTEQMPSLPYVPGVEPTLSPEERQAQVETLRAKLKERLDEILDMDTPLAQGRGLSGEEIIETLFGEEQGWRLALPIALAAAAAVAWFIFFLIRRKKRKNEEDEEDQNEDQAEEQNEDPVEETLNEDPADEKAGQDDTQATSGGVRDKGDA